MLEEDVPCRVLVPVRLQPAKLALVTLRAAGVIETCTAPHKKTRDAPVYGAECAPKNSIHNPWFPFYRSARIADINAASSLLSLVRRQSMSASCSGATWAKNALPACKRLGGEACRVNSQM